MMCGCSPLVLMVEDNEDVARLNRKHLIWAGFDVGRAATLAEAKKFLNAHSPDIVIMDILLPDGNGLEFLPEFKACHDAPVLFLSCRNEDQDIIRGLSAGGDDYIPKPYNIDILVARVSSLYRKKLQTEERLRKVLAANTLEGIIELGPLKLDIPAGRAYLNGEDAALKPKEFMLLLYFAQNEGREISARDLYEKIWKRPACDDIRSLWVHISQLRKKLSMFDGDPFMIESDYGNGYRFVYNKK